MNAQLLQLTHSEGSPTLGLKVSVAKPGAVILRLSEVFNSLASRADFYDEADVDGVTLHY